VFIAIFLNSPFIMKNQTFEIAPFYGFCFIPNNQAYPSGSSNPVAPTGRRTKLCWTEEEEAALRVTVLSL